MHALLHSWIAHSVLVVSKLNLTQSPPLMYQKSSYTPVWVVTPYNNKLIDWFRGGAQSLRFGRPKCISCMHEHETAPRAWSPEWVGSRGKAQVWSSRGKSPQKLLGFNISDASGKWFRKFSSGMLLGLSTFRLVKKASLSTKLRLLICFTGLKVCKSCYVF